MNTETWMALSNELEPILKKLKGIAQDYKLGDEPLDIAVFANENTWASYVEEKGYDGYVHYFEANVDSKDVFSMNEDKRSIRS